VRQLLATLWLTLSLTLFSPGRPTTIMGGILDTVVIFLAVEVMISKEFGRCVNIYNALYCILQRFVASAVTPRDYENQWLPLCTLTSSH
jgi:prolipoprotein diacylglyceryltransferase